MWDSIAMGTAAAVELDPEPISEKWVLSGSPIARSKVVARSSDWTSKVIVWDCTAGRFRWQYDQDETIIVISGAAYLLGDNGDERRFGPGDYGFFPEGTIATWRVDDHIRKIAVLHEPLWRPIGLALKVWNKFLRKVGLASSSPLGAS
jgi:uncharacterized protein